MRSVSIYQRRGAIYVLPKIGLVDIAPVFVAGLSKDEVVTALEGAIAAIPTDDAVPAVTPDYRSPVLSAMNVKSGAAYERGLKSAILCLENGSYKFYRFVPHPMFKSGFRKEDEPALTLPLDAPLSTVAERVMVVLDDPNWPMKKSQLPRSSRR